MKTRLPLSMLSPLPVLFFFWGMLLLAGCGPEEQKGKPEYKGPQFSLKSPAD